MPWKKAKKGHQLEIQERRAVVLDLYKKRYSQWEIASILNVDQGTVSRDVRAVENLLIASSIDDLLSVRIRELMDLDEMEKECIKRLNNCTHATQGSRWMEERLKIKKRRSKLLGLDSPQKYEVKKIEARLTTEQTDKLIDAALAGREVPAELLVHQDAPEQIVDQRFNPDLDDAPFPIELTDESAKSEKDKILEMAIKASNSDQ